MLGPEAVGKTTLLAIMYDSMTKMPCGWGLTANGDTSRELQEAFTSIYSQLDDSGNFSGISGLLAGTEGVRERIFYLSHGSEREVELKIYDIAGGLLTKGNEADPAYQEFMQKLREADVIINVVDGTSIMTHCARDEQPGEYIDVNNPQIVTSILEEAFNGTAKKRLIIFAITKCELWMKEEKKIKEMLNKFEKLHRHVLNFIKRTTNTNGVLIPVKTLGNVTFSHCDKGKPYFVKYGDYAPEFVDKILTYSLFFILSTTIDQQRSGLTKMWHTVTGKEKKIQSTRGCLHNSFGGDNYRMYIK